ncbi:MAG TPA: flagellar biosynthetic protein FliR [Myxococcales bacterium]|nr:flagellar biosynthetic protein FliR [Myxococcales bacterium]
MPPWASPALYGFALVLIRTSALFAVAPGLSSRNVPARVKLGAAAVIGWVAFTGAGMPPAPLPESLGALALGAGAEAVLGLLSGFASRAVLEAAAAAGQLAGLTTGLGYGALLDPASGAETTALGSLLGAAATGLAVELGLHRALLAELALSVRLAPPGAPPSLGPLAARALAQSLVCIELSVRLAFPVIAAGLFGHAAFGLLNRAAPQMNLSSIGFAVSLATGGLALSLAGPEIARACASAALAAVRVHG